MTFPDRPGVKFSLRDWVKLFVTIIPRLPNLLVYNRTSVTDGRVHSVGSNKQCFPVSTKHLLYKVHQSAKRKKEIREDWRSRVRYCRCLSTTTSTKLMVLISSYCFGGASCVRLGGTDLVNSVVICHPGPFTIDQVKAIKVPTAWVCAEGIY